MCLEDKIMVHSINNGMTLPIKSRPDTTGALASKPQTSNIFESVKTYPPVNIFGSSGGAETSGSVASGSGSSGGSGGGLSVTA